MTDPKSSDPRPGRGSRYDLGIRSPRLNAKWTLDALLGVGGMGAVYAATHRNGHRAAIKILHQTLSAHQDARERFLREGRIANSVQHPARVAILDDDESDEGEAFLVMELLEGETLWSLLERKGRLGDDAVMEIFDTVLELLVKCHAAEILHRDLKPDNIFLTRDGQIKVLDFGVARLRESRVAATREGTALGTPSFMSPEQARGRHGELDGRSDVFSVGACMYMAMTGEMLHASRNPMESLVFAGTRPAPSVALALPTLSRDVVALVDRALAFERDARFADAAAMLTELRRIRDARRAWAAAEARRDESPVSRRGSREVRIDSSDVPPAYQASPASSRPQIPVARISGFLREPRPAPLPREDHAAPPATRYEQVSAPSPPSSRHPRAAPPAFVPPTPAPPAATRTSSSAAFAVPTSPFAPSMPTGSSSSAPRVGTSSSAPPTGSSPPSSRPPARPSTRPDDSSYRFIAPRTPRKKPPAIAVDPATPRITRPVPLAATATPVPRVALATPTPSRPSRTAVYPRYLVEPPDDDAKKK